MHITWKTALSRFAVFGVLLSILFLITPSPAQAFGLPNVCQDANTSLATVKEWKGPQTQGADLIGAPGYGATAYEWWGSGGTSFSSGLWINDRYASEEAKSLCGIGGFFGMSGSMLAGIVWDNMVRVTDTALSTLQSAQSLVWIDVIADNLIVPLTSGRGGPDDIGLIDVYTSGLLVVFVAVGIWVVWRFIRRQHKEAVTGMFWNLTAALVGLVLLSQPLLLPNATSTVLGHGQKAVTDVANVITNTLADQSENVNLCVLDDSITYTNSFEVLNADGLAETRNVPSVSTRELACQLWVRSIYEPWSAGQFGTQAPVIAETHTRADGSQDTTRWNAENNAAIQAYIPGLKEQPPAGSLQALHLSALSLTAGEQRYLDMVRTAASPDGVYNKAYADAERSAKQALMGGADVEGNINENAGPLFQYPGPAILGGSTGIAPEVFQQGLNTKGHQERWDLTRQLVTETSQPGVVSVWGGTTGEATSMRTGAVTTAFVNSVLLVLPTSVFSLALLWYQLALGLMFAFLGLMLLAAVFPRFGLQVVKDYLNKVLKYMLMLTITLFFSSLIGLAVFALPNVLGHSGATRLLVGTLGMFALLLAWWKTSKGFKNVTLVRGANENSKVDLAGVATKATVEAGKTAAMSGAAVGMVAATGGMSAAAHAGGALVVSGVTKGTGEVQARAGAMMSESVDAFRSPDKETADKPAATAEKPQPQPTSKADDSPGEEGKPRPTETKEAGSTAPSTPPSQPVTPVVPVVTQTAPREPVEETTPITEPAMSAPTAEKTSKPAAPVPVPAPASSSAQPAQRVSTQPVTPTVRTQSAPVSEVASPEQLSLADLEPEKSSQPVIPSTSVTPNETAPPAPKRFSKKPREDEAE